LTVRVAIAQCAPALGAFKKNMAMHQDWIGRARGAGARMVLFPELSLTGYYLKDLAGDVACAADDARLRIGCCGQRQKSASQSGPDHRVKLWLIHKSPLNLPA